MKRLIITLAFSILTATSLLGLVFTPVVNAETDIYFKVDSVTWKEFSDTGTQILKETGELYGLGIAGKTDRLNAWTFMGKFELFGGSLDYDGQTQGGIPAQTDTDYFGLKLEGTIGWNFPVSEKASIEPFGGLGVRYWSRDLQSTPTGIGYEELWWSFYSKFGVHGDLVVSDTVKLFAEGGIILPISNENEVNLGFAGLGNITLEPGNEPSAFGEVGLRWKRLKVAAFYESLRFSKSDLVQSGGFVFWQPESEADIFGLYLGYSF